MTPRLLPYTPERDAYRLLGVPPTASSDEIQVACRRLARTFHPDRNRSGRATAEMQVVNVVRRVMTDPDERARYDWERRRFFDDLMQPMPSRAAPPNRRLHLPRARPSPAERYLRAVGAGARAALIGLVPPRCPGCRAVLPGEDAYCAGCGTPRLTGG